MRYIEPKYEMMDELVNSTVDNQNTIEDLKKAKKTLELDITKMIVNFKQDFNINNIEAIEINQSIFETTAGKEQIIHSINISINL